MATKAQLGWEDVLRAVREIAPEIDSPFTTTTLSNQANIDSVQAAKWLSKFCDWGYVRRGDFESVVQAGRRPLRIYHILKYGLEKELGGISYVDRLMQAIENLREASGEKAEAAALKALFQAHDYVEEERQKRFEKK
jgi:predicted ArsR family transcriptional regulator